MEAAIVTLLLLWSCTSKDDSEGSSQTDSRELADPVGWDTAADDDATDDTATDDTAIGETPTDDTVIHDTAIHDTAIDDTDGEPIELLIDPGFELGSEHWNIWGGAERVMGVGSTGDWALVATTENGAEQDVTGLEPGASYRLSGWARTEDGETMTIGVKDHGNPEDRVAFTSADWSEGSLTFTTGDAVTSATLYAYKHDGEAVGYADDLSLVVESGAAD